MALKIVIGIYVIATLIALLHPRFAILLFWPLLLLYPHWLLYQQLPLNAGLEDVFLVSLFIGSLMKSGGRVHAKQPVIFAVLFCVIFVLGDVALVITGDLNMAFLWQQWLKSLGLLFFVYSISSMVATPEQIKKMVYSFLFGAFVGAIFVIYYVVFPHTYNPFQIPYYIAGRVYQKQQIGPFSETALAGAVLGFAVLIGYFYIRFAKDRHKRPIIVIVTGVMLLALAVCTARKGWLFVLFPVILSSLLSKQKILGLVLLVVIALGVIAASVYFPVFSERLDWTIWQITGGTLQSATSNRWEIWVEHLSDPKISWLFCGEGFTKMEGVHVHNNFIGILKGMGLAGVLFWFVYYVKVIRKSSWLKRCDPNPDMAVFFHAVFWCYIGYFIYSIPSTPVMWPNVRYIDFFLMTLIFLRYKQVESEVKYSFEQEQYQTELDYAQTY